MIDPETVAWIITETMSLIATCVFVGSLALGVMAIIG